MGVRTPLFDAFVTTQSAEDAFTNVLADVGCNVPVLDEHDQRIIEETRDGTTTSRAARGCRLCPTPRMTPAVATLARGITAAADFDTDHDGIPDAWEKAHGLNPSDASDGNKTNLSKVGYTNLEMYPQRAGG